MSGSSLVCGWAYRTIAVLPAEGPIDITDRPTTSVSREQAVAALEQAKEALLADARSPR
jgi:hypothetical protein